MDESKEGPIEQAKVAMKEHPVMAMRTFLTKII
jgi:hypothetical protein